MSFNPRISPLTLTFSNGISQRGSYDQIVMVAPQSYQKAAAANYLRGLTKITVLVEALKKLKVRFDAQLQKAREEGTYFVI